MRCDAKALTVHERGGAVFAKKTVVEKNAAVGFGGAENSGVFVCITLVGKRL
jgi:hypothetical protein